MVKEYIKLIQNYYVIIINCWFYSGKNMNLKLFITLVIFLLSTSSQATEKFNDSERAIISSLYDVRMIGKAEMLCYDWDGEMSNMQTIYWAGIGTVLREMLGKERFYRYYRVSKNETITLIDMESIKRLKNKGDLKAVKDFCVDELSYWRNGTANNLLNSALSLIKDE